MALVHASCVEYLSKGILIQGASGAGKSDLALRIIDAGGILISDDYVEVVSVENNLIAHTAPNIEGMIEVRGVGLVNVAFTNSHKLDLVLELCAPTKIDRLPEEKYFEQDGVCVPLYQFDAFSASALAKINLLIRDD